MIESFFVDQLYPRILEIMQAPLVHREMFWTIIPLLGAITLMELYYGHHKAEKLGWNSAYGNTIALFFVLANLLKNLFSQYDIADMILFTEAFYKLGLIVLLGCQTLLLMYFNYFHSLPKWLSWFVSSTIPTTGLALVTVVVVFGEIPIDKLTLIAGFIVLLGLAVVFTLVRILTPIASEDKSKLQALKELVIGKI